MKQVTGKFLENNFSVFKAMCDKLQKYDEQQSTITFETVDEQSNVVDVRSYEIDCNAESFASGVHKLAKDLNWRHSKEG